MAMRDIGSHAPRLKAMGDPKALGSRRSGRAGEPAAGESVRVSESLDDVPQDRRLPSYPPAGPTDRLHDLYGSLSTILGISATRPAVCRRPPRTRTRPRRVELHDRERIQELERTHCDEGRHLQEAIPSWCRSGFNEIPDGVGENCGEHDRAANETRNGWKFRENEPREHDREGCFRRSE